MMIKKYHHQSFAQSTAEYAVLLAIVASALIGMQVYIKRSLQGRLRDLADQIAPAQSHYEPGLSSSFYTTNQTGNIIQNYTNGTTSVNQTENIDRSGWEYVLPETEEYVGSN